MQPKQLIDKLEATSQLTKEEWIALIENRNHDIAQYLFAKARNWQQKYFGNQIYTRGLIEFTNYCKNDCYYCGIRRSSQSAERYRLTKEQIMECCETGYKLGFRTFVLQGGEDGWFTQQKLEEIVRVIKKNYSDCAITPELTAICCGMRRPIPHITKVCIPRNCQLSIASNVFGI